MKTIKISKEVLNIVTVNPFYNTGGVTESFSKQAAAALGVPGVQIGVALNKLMLDSKDNLNRVN